MVFEKLSGVFGKDPEKEKKSAEIRDEIISKIKKTAEEERNQIREETAEKIAKSQAEIVRIRVDLQKHLNEQEKKTKIRQLEIEKKHLENLIELANESISRLEPMLSNSPEDIRDRMLSRPRKKKEEDERRLKEIEEELKTLQEK